MTIVAATESNFEKKHHGKAKTFSGRPNPINVAYEKKMADIDMRIATAKAKLDDLKAGGKNLSGADREARNSLFENLKEAREKLRPHLDEKKRLVDQLNKAREDLKKKTGEQQDAKDKLPFRSIPEMEQKVAELEARIESGQLKLIEEKQTLAEISKLKKARKALENLDSGANDVSSLRLRIDKLRTLIAEKDDAVKGLKAKTDEISSKIDALNGAKAEADKTRQDRQAQIEKVKKELDQAYQDRRASYEEYRNAKRAQFEAREKREARRVEYERRREIEDKLEDLEEKLLAFNPETMTDKKISECNNLKSFFQEFLQSSSSTESTNEDVNKLESRVRAVKLSQELANAESIKKTDDEYFFAPKPKKGTKNTSSQTSSASSTGVSLSKLPLHILSGLADLALSIPSNPEEIPKLFDAIEKRKSELSAKKDDAVEEKEKQRKALEEQIAELKKELEKPIKVQASSTNSDVPSN